MSTPKASPSGKAIAHSRPLGRPPHSFVVRALTPEPYRAEGACASEAARIRPKLFLSLQIRADIDRIE
jgi:hypothetical protein